MRPRLASSFSTMLALVVGAAGCESTGAVGGMDAGTGGVDAGPGGSPSLTYTPMGCAYAVSTPTVSSATMGGDVVGTSPAPDHVHVSWAGPTTSTFAVNWHTGADTTLSQVLYGTDEAMVRAADAAGAGVTVQQGHTMFYSTIADPRGTGTRLHEAHVCGLASGTRYFYKVGGPGHWSSILDVSTGPEIGSTSPWSFAVTGDSRNDASAVAEIMQQVSTHAVDFQVFSGDAVVAGVNQGEWNAFFEATSGSFGVQDLYARVPFMPTNGNHDALAVNYVAQFALPQQVSGDELAQGEEWYSFDYANAHVVVLNDTPTSRVTGTQADWLRADLGAVNRTTTPWVFVVHHIPAYSASTNHGSDIGIRSAWQPIFDQFNVDIVFNGHDHNYERTKPIRGFQAGSQNGELAATGANGVPVAESGTIYVVAAGSGAPLYGNGSDYFTYTSESVRNYVVVEIEGRTMHFTAYRNDGSMLDQFDYTK